MATITLKKVLPVLYYRVMLTFNNKIMKNIIIQETEEYLSGDGLQSNLTRANAWKTRQLLRQQRHFLRRKLFGDHYNYSKVGLNKEKKYLIEQQRNTEIQRSNRILLQKIQRISKRSVPTNIKRLTYTQQQDASIDNNQNLQSQSRKLINLTSLNKNQKSIQKTNQTLDNSKKIRKLLFKGSKQFQGIIIPFKTYVENNIFTIFAEIGKIKQKIEIEIELYRKFYNSFLQTDHSKIMQFLRFNGNLLELSEISKQKVSVEEQEYLSLPSISNKIEAKQLEGQKELENKLQDC